jgi:uncharacterized protein
MVPNEFLNILNGQEKHSTAASTLFTQLYGDGFFVDKDIDERAIGELSYQDKIYDNTLNITILGSEQCNFRCKYCYEDFKRGNITGEVIDSFLLFIKRNLHKYNKVNIDWFGGEPLLADKEIETISAQLLKMCQKAGKPYAASMTTNGYLLNAEMLRRMLRCRVTNFQITLDGLAETHDKSRVLANGGPTFDRIISNLTEIRDKVKSGLFKITLRTNLTRPQLPLINRYIEFLNAEFSADKRFEFYFRPAGDWGGDRVKGIRDNLVTSFKELYEPLLMNIGALNMNAYYHLLKIPICMAAERNSFVLGSDGTIYKCTMLFNEDFNRIGKLNNKGKMEIEQNKLAKWITPPEDMSQECNRCNNWNICHNRICPAKAFRTEGSKFNNCGYERKSLDCVRIGKYIAWKEKLGDVLKT